MRSVRFSAVTAALGFAANGRWSLRGRGTSLNRPRGERLQASSLPSSRRSTQPYVFPTSTDECVARADAFSAFCDRWPSCGLPILELVHFHAVPQHLLRRANVSFRSSYVLQRVTLRDLDLGPGPYDRDHEPTWNQIHRGPWRFDASPFTAPSRRPGPPGFREYRPRCRLGLRARSAAHRRGRRSPGTR